MSNMLIRGVITIWLGLSSSVMAQTLTVDFQGVHSASGSVRFSLYNDPKTFRKEAQALKVLELPAQQGTVTAVFPNIASGQYAIMVYHDEDHNGRLNLFMGMIPEEGYGLSNNPHPIGPPSFEDSAFSVNQQDERINIEARY